nr:protein MIS12 homolog [Tanacetum cinerariifolium]
MRRWVHSLADDENSPICTSLQACPMPCVLNFKIDGSERAGDLTEDLNHIRFMIQSSLDKRLSMWEKYDCFLHIFVVSEEFSLPNDDEASAGDLMDVDVVGNSDHDASLDSLRTKLALVEQESVGFKKEIQALEKQSVLKAQRYATELRTQINKVNTGRAGGIQHLRLERIRLFNGDSSRMIGENGLQRNSGVRWVVSGIEAEKGRAQVLGIKRWSVGMRLREVQRIWKMNPRRVRDHVLGVKRL